MIEVRTQSDLDKALKKTNGGRNELIVCLGGGRFVARGNSNVEAWGNSNVEAWGNSNVVARENSNVVARENSSVVARENSSVVAWGNSSVVARENSNVEAWGNSSVRAFSHRGKIKAAKYAVVIRHNPAAKISGGRVLEAHSPKIGGEWCEFYGVKVRKGGSFSRKLKGQDVAILYKALGENFTANHGFTYEPGSTPEAPDWDGGKQECGGGLHFSPHPKMAREFNLDPAHFVACPVLVSEIVIHPDGTYPAKCKAPRVCAPCWEVDRDGNKVEADEKAAA